MCRHCRRNCEFNVGRNIKKKKKPSETVKLEQNVFVGRKPAGIRDRQNELLLGSPTKSAKGNLQLLETQKRFFTM